MKLLFLLGVLIPLISYNQKQSNVWYFGTGVGLDFNNSNCAPTLLTDGAMHGYEGCTTIADEVSGELLFYTNSDMVWNRDHQPMISNSLVPGGSTITQSVIVKKPSSDSLYYIITSEIQGVSGGGLRFHCVNMQMNNGLGGLAYRDSVLCSQHVTEKLVAVRRANGSDIWVIGHEYGSNRFLAFLLTPSGFDTIPVISAIGKTYSGNGGFTIDCLGEMKASPDGTKLAVVTYRQPNIELFTFNGMTGQVSDLITLPEMGAYNGSENSSSGLYGLSFSPDNTKLYASSFAEPPNNLMGKIIQYTISSGNASTIIGSRVDIFNSAIISCASMKIAPDGKIYVAHDFNSSGGNYIGVINHPNLTGIACEYIDTSINLHDDLCSWGLNNLMEYGEYCSVLETNEIENPGALFIYPNPANEKFYIDCYDVTGSEMELIIYDASGRAIRKILTHADSQLHIEREELGDGLYFVQLFQSQQLRACARLILE